MNTPTVLVLGADRVSIVARLQQLMDIGLVAIEADAGTAGPSLIVVLDGHSRAQAAMEVLASHNLSCAPTLDHPRETVAQWKRENNRARSGKRS